MPRAFGRFKKNLTVFSVCEECNQWFGDNLEVSFTRNSGEAVSRLLSGVKSAREGPQIAGDRIEIMADDGTAFAGGRSYFTEHTDGTLIASYVAQVGFRATEDQQPVLFAEEELTREIVEQYRGCEAVVICETESDFERLAATLNEHGYHHESVLCVLPNASLPLVREPLRVDYRLDKGVFRTIGKIAFNYLAYVAGAAFCLSPDFDAFRRFVRYGEGDWQSFMAISLDPLLSQERLFGIRQTSGHLLVVEWLRGNDSLTGSVKLFNDIHYHIRFASRMTVVWREIMSGHHFRTKTLTIAPITIFQAPA